jgi:hypothetical protein
MDDLAAHQMLGDRWKSYSQNAQRIALSEPT